MTRAWRIIRETRERHLGFGWRNSAEFARFRELLPPAGFCCGARRRGGQRILDEAAPVAARTLRRADRSRTLAAAPCDTMRCQRQGRRTGTALGGSGCRPGNDSVSSTDCRVPCGPIQRARKMKRKAIIAGVVAALPLLVAAYIWGPSSVPPGQPPLLTVSGANFSEFETAFDADTSVPRVVLLLSPT